MKHSSRCEQANPKSKCQCRCGGRFHGIAHGKDDYNMLIRTINENMGGEIENEMKLLKGKKFKCTCGKQTIINSFLGYPHEGGIEADDKEKWWVFFKCPHCNYQWSIDKLNLK